MCNLLITNRICEYFTAMEPQTIMATCIGENNATIALCNGLYQKDDSGITRRDPWLQANPV